MPAASTPRRSTPRRARSSSVASNTSRSSSRAPNSRGKAAAAAKKDERPSLPEERNPILPVEPVPVKLQVINRENKDIVIGRVKLDTVNGANHGFLLKRFDTNAIAASSMFRLAFPYADGEAERVEMAYLDRKYDTDRANGGTIAKPATPKRGRPKKNASKDDEDDKSAAGRVLPEGSTGIRLQGTWLPCENALEIAQEYGLSLYATPLIEAEAVVVDGVPQLVGEQAAVTTTKTAPDTPTSARKRQRTSKAAEAAAAAAEESGAEESVKGTPKASRTRTKRVVKDDGTEETSVTKTTTIIEPAENGMSQKEIDEEIKKSKALAEQVQAERKKAAAQSPSKAKSAGRKRRASNERPSADLDQLADDSSVNFVSRNVRRGTRAVRRRPIATGAGAFGVAAAAGVGALAWLSGGQVDVAQQLISQGFNAFQGFFF